MLFLSKTTRELITSLQLIRHFAKRANPGLSYQIHAIEDAVEVIQSDPEGFEGLESDLFSAHKSHKEHELEQKRQREKVKRYIIKNKYFRDVHLPNLLTYAEKEQIRYLHSYDSEEWTVDKLADSFPASAEIISKIVKSDWTPISSKRLRLHDASVIKNWDRFKNGEYKAIIPKELEDHLNKFADRDELDIKSLTNRSIIPRKQWQKPNSTEFSSIICTLHKKSNDSAKSSINKPKDSERYNSCLSSETYLQGVIKNRKQITIRELKSKYDLLERQEELISDDSSTSNKLPMQEECTNMTGMIPNKNNSSIFNANDDYKKCSLNEIDISEVDKSLHGITHTKQ